jgi:hypothetical protein
MVFSRCRSAQSEQIDTNKMEYKVVKAVAAVAVVARKHRNGGTMGGKFCLSLTLAVQCD